MVCVCVCVCVVWYVWYVCVWSPERAARQNTDEPSPLELAAASEGGQEDPPAILPPAQAACTL